MEGDNYLEMLLNQQQSSIPTGYQEFGGAGPEGGSAYLISDADKATSDAVLAEWNRLNQSGDQAGIAAFKAAHPMMFENSTFSDWLPLITDFVLPSLGAYGAVSGLSGLLSPATTAATTAETIAPDFMSGVTQAAELPSSGLLAPTAPLPTGDPMLQPLPSPTLDSMFPPVASNSTDAGLLGLEGPALSPYPLATTGALASGLGGAATTAAGDVIGSGTAAEGAAAIGGKTFADFLKDPTVLKTLLGAAGGLLGGSMSKPQSQTSGLLNYTPRPMIQQQPFVSKWGAPRAPWS